MANTIDFILTNSAAELIQKVIGGKTLNFTRMAVGDGFSYDPEIAKGFTTLVNEVLSLDITKQETLTPTSVKFTSAFKNTDAQREFYYREVGLYAEDPDTGKEVLYAYGNRNDAAELITPAGSNIVTKQLIFIISVGDSANITFNVNADVYALQEDMLDVQENLEQIQTNLGKAQTNITNLQSGLNQTNTNVTTLQTNLGKANTNITTLQTDVGQAKTNITNLQSGLNQTNTNVTNLQTNLGKANTNITTLQTDLGQTNTNITSLQSGKANKNLVNTGMITNCLLEVPQRIKYELTDGILTIKTGSIIPIPYGTENLSTTYPIGSTFLHKNFKVVDTQFSSDNKFFVWIEIQSDISFNSETSLDQKWIHLVPTTAGLRSMVTNYESSGSETPTNFFNNNYACWYDTVNNYVKWTDNSMSTWTICTFPIFLYTIGKSVDLVFNGMGYIGSTIWVDKGVKGLIPNGRNPDGSLNNIEWEQASLYVRTLSTTDDNYNAIFGLNGAELSRNKDIRIVYNPDLNFNLMNGDPWLNTMCGTFTQTAGVVSNFKLKKPIQIMDYNDYLKKINELENRISALETN